VQLLKFGPLRRVERRKAKQTTFVDILNYILFEITILAITSRQAYSFIVVN